MMVFLIGGAVAGVVLGASNRVVFLLPAALMALVVASVLIVRADLDVAFTALTASVFSGGYLLGVVKANTRPGLLRFPRPAPLNDHRLSHREPLQRAGGGVSPFPGTARLLTAAPVLFGVVAHHRDGALACLARLHSVSNVVLDKLVSACQGTSISFCGKPSKTRADLAAPRCFRNRRVRWSEL